ncbi:CHAD domain-containing protein [Desulfuromonas thiophila]|uniref:CHAD domain-containing protein n=1 Tax=Desulfuromonas thiophila TaxID=57664 RepID=UPI0024A7ECFD|nr:CHAD domain-containing protein [Desulfuromonas thiophila]
MSPSPAPFGLKKKHSLAFALPLLVRVLLRQADRQRHAILTGDDPEALHQYRVALRKARSLLRLFRRQLGPVAALLARQLAQTAQMSNGLREIDVLLHDWAGWSERLPAELQPAAGGVRLNLQAQRDVALQSFRRQLATLPAPLELLADSLDPNERADRPLKKPLRRVFRQQKRRLKRARRQLTAASPAADFHRARIAGKRLRYLLELFAEVRPPRQNRRRIERLRQLQDLLGQLQDAESHGHHLAGLAAQPVWTQRQQAVLTAVREQLLQQACQLREGLLGHNDQGPAK